MKNATYCKKTKQLLGMQNLSWLTPIRIESLPSLEPEKVTKCPCMILILLFGGTQLWWKLPCILGYWARIHSCGDGLSH